MPNKYTTKAKDVGLTSAQELVQFGLQFLPEQFETNEDLADFYFDLSETAQGLNKEQKSFCIEVCLYCKDSYPSLHNKDIIEKEYHRLFI